MKHYTRKNWFEYMAYEGDLELNNPRFRKSVAEVKTGYRRRERAALKRLTEHLVAEEVAA